MFPILFPPTFLKLTTKLSTKNRKIILVSAMALAAIGAGLVFVSARSRFHIATRNKTSPTTAALPTQRLYVRAGALWPKLRWNLKAIGDRLERPGKEQVTITGTLTRAGVSSPIPIVVNIETPHRMTLTRQTGLQTEVIQFNGTNAAWEKLSATDRGLVETLFYDSAEAFFFGQARGAATRSLGFRFRLNEEDISGPFYDIYAVTHRNDLPSSREGTKLFCFNSESMLLDIVRYQAPNDNFVRVETRLSGWRDLNGQKVAHRIDRLENGLNVMTFNIVSVAFAPGTRGGTL